MSKKSWLVLSFLLVLPALVFVTAGLLSLIFGMAAANHFVDAVLGRPFLGWFFSPALVLGGPAAVVVLQARRLCGWSVQKQENGVSVSLTVHYIFRSWLALLAGVMLLVLLLGYAFVENFQIVQR